MSTIYSNDEIRILFRIAAEHISNFSPIKIHLEQDYEITSEEGKKYESFLKRLSQNEPVQYITGYTWFMDLKIQVNHSVLIPRPETEEMVNLILEDKIPDSPMVLDACTGSGCIAIALKKYLKDSDVFAFDISSEALETARLNMLRNEVDVKFFKADINLHPPDGLPLFDVIVSNPPYIPASEAKDLAPQVLKEPSLALFVPDIDQFRYYKSLLKWTDLLLKPGGILICEGHASNISGLLDFFQESGFSKTSILKDLSGNDRFVSGRR